MKILHVLYSGLGGHGNVFFSLVKADTQNEFEHEALFNGVEELREEYTARCRQNNIKFNFIKKQSGLDLRFYKNLVLAIKKSDPQVIFLHGSTQVLWAKIAVLFKKVKPIILIRETQANHLKTKQDWFWLAAALLLANKIVFLTPAYQQEIKKKLSWLYQKNRAKVIPNGIDLEQYKPHTTLQHDAFVIGMQSRIVKIKDHITLLHAFAILLKNSTPGSKKVYLKIAGDGDCRKGLVQLAKELDIDKNVEFTGMLTEQELVQFLDGLDIYIHASYGETMSTALMQAMACSLPIIASDVPGINNMIKDGKTGLLIPAGDKEKMAATIQLYLQDDIYRTELAQNAYRFAVENYSNKKMFTAYKTIFEKQ